MDGATWGQEPGDRGGAREIGVSIDKMSFSSCVA